MKKILLFLVVFNFQKNLQSQSMFCLPGAKWTYLDLGYISGIDGITEFKYTGDTIINSFTCKKIDGTFKGWKIGYSYSNNNIVIPHVVDYIVRENNKVVYLYNGSSFDTVVNFNASIGDKWLELGIAGPSGCTNSRTYYKVVDTSHVIVNNVSLKRIITTYSFVINNSITPQPFTNIYLEKVLMQVGNFGAYAELFNSNCKYAGIPEIPLTYLLCYEDNSFPQYKFTSRNCDDLTNISKQEIFDENFSIYPNPLSDILIVKTKNNSSDYNFTLVNVLGELCACNTINATTETQMNLSQLNSGIYFLQIWKDGKLMGVKKIVKE